MDVGAVSSGIPLTMLVGILAMSVLAACGGATEENGDASVASPQECVDELVDLTDGEVSAAKLVERCEVSASQAEAAVSQDGERVDPPPTSEPDASSDTAAKTSESREPTAEEPVVLMPDIPCGSDLQLAQDMVQDAGVFLSRSEDATGQDRFQIMDRNWTVVYSDPPAGTPIGEDEAVFYVVKDDEFTGC